MPRTKGSKNRPKTTHTDYASQVAEKQESKKDCFEESRKRSGISGSEEGKGRC